MNCQVCKKGQFEFKEIHNNLKAKECNSCNGIWISYSNYNKYLELNPPMIEDINFANLEPCSNDNDSLDAKICYDCGAILVKTMVGFDINFYVDRCPSCHGIWLDNGEWDKLSKNHIENLINFFFTDYWKNRIFDYNKEKRWKQLLQREVGSGNLLKIFDFIDWLKKQDKKENIIAYINKEVLY